MKLKSDNVLKGLERAPHRSLFKAMGYTDEELSRPLIAIANSANEIIPGHIHLDTIVEAVKAGVRMAGGTPIEFGVIGVCDGIAMGHEGMKYSLASREVIADSIECMVMAHAFDGMVMVPNCDKIIPGMLMAAGRINLPCIVISGGPMLAGKHNGQRVDLNSLFEGVGAVSSGKMTEAELKELEDTACPGCGSCSGMFTANTMNCMTEVLGMGLPGNGTIPAVEASRIRLAKTAGMRVLDLIRQDLRPRDILTEKAFANAFTVDMAIGGSTNTALHLPAIAHEVGISIDLNWVNEVSKKTPHIAYLRPGGIHHIQDLTTSRSTFCSTPSGSAAAGARLSTVFAPSWCARSIRAAVSPGSHSICISTMAPAPSAASGMAACRAKKIGAGRDRDRIAPGHVGDDRGDAGRRVDRLDAGEIDAGGPQAGQRRDRRTNRVRPRRRKPPSRRRGPPPRPDWRPCRRVGSKSCARSVSPGAAGRRAGRSGRG